jgi:hypothetical protein
MDFPAVLHNRNCAASHPQQPGKKDPEQSAIIASEVEAPKI